jgi:transcriptional regulator with XRE-family HTH domain
MRAQSPRRDNGSTTMCLTAATTSGMIWRMGQGSDQDAGSDREEHAAWDHLAQLIRERRAELGLTQREVHSVGGPSPATLYQLESGHRGSYRPHILRRLERALGWGAGSVRRALAGGMPLLEGEADRPPARPEHPSGPPRPVHAEPLNTIDWIDGFRNLPIDTREKLVILSSLLEETIAGLGRRSPVDQAVRPPGASR